MLFPPHSYFKETAPKALGKTFLVINLTEIKLGKAYLPFKEAYISKRRELYLVTLPENRNRETTTLLTLSGGN